MAGDWGEPDFDFRTGESSQQKGRQPTTIAYTLGNISWDAPYGFGTTYPGVYHGQRCVSPGMIKTFECNQVIYTPTFIKPARITWNKTITAAVRPDVVAIWGTELHQSLTLVGLSNTYWKRQYILRRHSKMGQKIQRLVVPPRLQRQNTSNGERGKS